MIQPDGVLYEVVSARRRDARCFVSVRGRVVQNCQSVGDGVLHVLSAQRRVVQCVSAMASRRKMVCNKVTASCTKYFVSVTAYCTKYSATNIFTKAEGIFLV